METKQPITVNVGPYSSAKITGHIANKNNPHETSFDNISGENPSFTKAETTELLSSRANKADLADKMNLTGTGGTIDKSVGISTRGSIVLESQNIGDFGGSRSIINLKPDQLEIVSHSSSSLKEHMIANGEETLFPSGITVKSGIQLLNVYPENTPFIPYNPEDAATKKYVDDLAATKQHKPPVLTQKVDTPIWTKQPTIAGTLDETFQKWDNDYYFVTLKDTSGTALPAGQFKLTAAENGYATAINQIFNLPNLDTGNNGSLTENKYVDFKEIGTGWKLRHAGVTDWEFGLPTELRNCNINISTVFRVKIHMYFYFRIIDYLPKMYRTLTSVGMYTGDGGWLLPGVSGASARKHLIDCSTLDLRRHEKAVKLTSTRSVGGWNGTFNNPTDGFMWNAPAANSMLFSTNPAAYPIDKPWTKFGFIFYQNTLMNGSEVIIKELI